MDADKIIAIIIWVIAAILLSLVLLGNKAHAGGLQGAMMGTFAWEMDREIWTEQKPPSRKYAPATSQPKQPTPKTSIGQLKSWLTSKKSKPTTPTTTSITIPSSTCESQGTTWTVPDGTRKVKVRVINTNGTVSSSYTISDFVTLRPGQQLVVIPSC